MKLLLYADLQATDGSEVCYHDPTVRLQDWRVQRFFEVMHRVYAEHECNGLIDLGDTTDDRSAIPVPTINTLITNLEHFDGWNVKLIGNHEQYTRDARIHIGKLFEHRFTVINGVADWKSPDSDAIFVFASYPGSYTTLVEELAKLVQKHKGKKLALFGHFQTLGCQLNSGLAYEGVPKQLLAHFTTGFLGHVHKPQTLVPNVHYVGSPFQQNFGESGEAKRVAIFDTIKLTVKWVSLADYGFPLYRTVTAAEFVDMVDEDSEDRYHVVLSSQADTELFFSHPLCSRAETEYSYTSANSPTSEIPQSWTFESVLSRWMAKNPPNDLGINIPDPEMLDIGVQIANGNT